MLSPPPPTRAILFPLTPTAPRSDQDQQQYNPLTNTPSSTPARLCRVHRTECTGSWTAAAATAATANRRAPFSIYRGHILWGLINRLTQSNPTQSTSTGADRRNSKISPDFNKSSLKRTHSPAKDAYKVTHRQTLALKVG